MRFDPFESRLCRDVRNQLGHDFVHAIQHKDPDGFYSRTGKCLESCGESSVAGYVRQRREMFGIVYKNIYCETSRPVDFFHGMRVLWNQGLYFECHEWIEERWLDAAGDERKVLQGILLAAIAMEHQTYERPEPSLKLARKAAALIHPGREMIAPFCSNIDELVAVLKAPQPFPKLALMP